MKRNREFLDENVNIISVMKVVAHYGFDNMQDLSVFSRISKYFYNWMNQNVIARGILILAVYERETYFKTILNYPFPRLSLLTYS